MREGDRLAGRVGDLWRPWFWAGLRERRLLAPAWETCTRPRWWVARSAEVALQKRLMCDREPHPHHPSSAGERRVSLSSRRRSLPRSLRRGSLSAAEAALAMGCRP